MEKKEVESYDIKLSDGAVACKGDEVTVHYRIAKSLDELENGPWIEDSEKKSAVTFTLGDGEVHRGIEIGMEGMCVAGTRRIIIPPRFAFGDIEVPGLIPPDTTLYFEVYLISIKKKM
jgi:FKBP-type peptidyl-prolyl cis-trans isomerase